MNRISSRLLLAALIAASGTITLAQSGPAAQGQGGGRMDPATMQQNRAALHEKYMTELKEQLKLAPEQETAWTTFVTAMQPITPPARPSSDELAKMTQQERAEMREQRQAMSAAIRQGRTKQNEEAIQALRAQLTPEQQKVLDQHAVNFGPQGQGKGRGMGQGGGRGRGQGGGRGMGQQGGGCGTAGASPCQTN